VALSWAFVLRDLGSGRTRLIARLRSRWPRGPGHWLVNRLSGEPAHFIMERKMLLTIKCLAEAARVVEASAQETAEGRLVHP
jgi:hypothetical protein